MENVEVRKKVIGYKQAFGSEAGEEVLKDLAGYCRINQSAFFKREGEPADPYEMAFLSGRQDIFHYIKRIIDLDLPPE